MTSLKTCFKCAVAKSLDDFYKHPAMADGHLGKCKVCTKTDSTNRRNSKIDQVRAYDRARGNRQTGNVWRAADRRRPKCHDAVARAIKAGTLHRQPCEVCRADKVVAHHDSYDHPLLVRWLCQAHHRQWHRDNPEVK